MYAHPDRERSVQLLAGEKLFLHIPAGCSITASLGSLLLEGPPCWLGEIVVRTQLKIAPGETCRLDSAGWITLAAGARDAATVRLSEPAAAGWTAAIAQLLARLYGSRPPQGSCPTR